MRRQRSTWGPLSMSAPTTFSLPSGPASATFFAATQDFSASLVPAMTSPSRNSEPFLIASIWLMTIVPSLPWLPFPLIR